VGGNPDWGISSASFSPDGQRVITAQFDETARVWDLATGKQLKDLSGHDGVVLDAGLSPNGRRAITGSRDKKVVLWDLERDEPVAVLADHGDYVNTVKFSKDGRKVLTASNDGTARIWSVFPTTEAAVDYAIRMVPRCLTPSERDEAFLDHVPPSWCIEMAKWPYFTEEWKDWLRQSSQNPSLPLPKTPTWEGSPVVVK
jgi:WD40 repeat protein